MANNSGAAQNDKPAATVPLGADECQLLVGCMDAAVKQAQDSMAVSFKLFPIREKFEKHLKALGEPDGNTDSTN